MKRLLPRALMALAIAGLVTTVAAAQPTLDSLWPNDDGLSWRYAGTFRDLPEDPVESYNARLIFDGTATMAPGVTVQRLLGQLNELAPAKARSGVPPMQASPLLRSLWWGRPDLRPAIEARMAQSRRFLFWPWLYLSPADVVDGTGFRKTTNEIGSWRDMIGDWSWLYFQGDPTDGQMFTLQLIPDLASDVFLHVTVQSTATSINTEAGTFDDAVMIELLVDQGTAMLTDEQGVPIGTVASEIDGWIAFVPGVGPVAMEQLTRFTVVDCPNGCPEFEALLGEDLGVGTLSLSEAPVATETSTWSEVKARY